MIKNEEIKTLIVQGISGAEVIINGDGYHYVITVISDLFIDVSRINRQKMVYKTLGEKIKSGELHAMTIKTYAAKDWEEKQDG
jgi:acid stress-induced BolA-like protein IbaG/YrbA